MSPGKAVAEVAEDWQAAAAAAQVGEAELEAAYVEALGDLRFDSAELQDNHSYRAQATQPADARFAACKFSPLPTAKRLIHLRSNTMDSTYHDTELDFRSRQTSALLKEMKQWPDVLPVHPHAAVFVRQASTVANATFQVRWLPGFVQFVTINFFNTQTKISTKKCSSEKTLKTCGKLLTGSIVLSG